jgi:hypothetical protein
MPDEAETPPAQDEKDKTRGRQADVRRAIAAAEKAGLRSYRVEIAFDGTISIVVGSPIDTPATPGSSD